MLPSFEQIIEWVRDHDAELWTVGAASVLVLVATIIIIPAIVARIPPDYFTHEQRPEGRWTQQYRVVRIGLLVGKNALGYVFIVAGLAMLLLPGQGLLTILIGFLMIDFPGKYRFEKWLIHRRTVRRSINWLRKRAGRKPLETS